MWVVVLLVLAWRWLGRGFDQWCDGERNKARLAGAESVARLKGGSHQGLDLASVVAWSCSRWIRGESSRGG
jgi:hypothetical protein